MVLANYILKARRKEASEKRRIKKIEDEKKMSEKDKVQLQIDELKSKIISVSNDLKGCCKGSVVVENKLNHMLKQKEALEIKLKEYG